MHIFTGVSASPGVVIGPVEQIDHGTTGLHRIVCDPFRERALYDVAVVLAKDELRRLSQRAKGPDADILLFQIALLEDESFTNEIGDYIAAGDIEGTVSEIGFFATKIITADNKQVSYPNAALSNTSVTDYTALGTRRIDLVFSTSYDSDIDTVKNILINVASADSLVFSEPKPEAHLSNHADSALEFKLMVWCKSSDYWTVRYNMLENVKKAFDKEKIEIPYPKLDVSVQQVKGEK